MKKLINIFILLFISSGLALANTQPSAQNVTVTTGTFTSCLGSGNTNVQSSLNSLDGCLSPSNVIRYLTGTAANMKILTDVSMTASGVSTTVGTAGITSGTENGTAASTAGMSSGQYVTIGRGATLEQKHISQITGLTTFTVTSNFLYNHVSGDTIIVNTLNVNNKMSSTGTVFTSADVGKSVNLAGAGLPYTNITAGVPGTYAPGTYNEGDVVIVSPSSGKFINWNSGNPIWFFQEKNNDTTTYFDPFGNFFPLNPYPANGGSQSGLNPTSQNVTGQIGSVDGSGNAYIVDLNGQPVFSYTTISNATLHYATNDTPVFQAAINGFGLTGGDLHVPSGDYCANNILMGSNVHIYLEAGATFFPCYGPSIQGNSGFIGSIFEFSYNSLSAPGISNAWLIGNGNLFDYSYATKQLQTTSGVTSFDPSAAIVYNCANCRIEGITGNYFPAGDVVQVNSLGGSITVPNPTNLVIKDIKDMNSPFGFGAVQIDGAEQVNLENLSSDWGFALDLEPDNTTTNGRTLHNIYANHMTDNSYVSTPYMATSTVNIAAHNNHIDNFRISDVTGLNGAGGVSIDYSVSTSTLPQGYIDHGTVKGVYVSGGGLGLHIGTDQVFTDMLIENLFVTGNNKLVGNNGFAVESAVNFTTGMTFRNVISVNGDDDGFQQSYFDGYWPNGVSTTVNSSYTAGSTTLVVASSQNMYVGQTLTAASGDIAVIAASGISGTTITLVSGFANNYSSGQVITAPSLSAYASGLVKFDRCISAGNGLLGSTTYGWNDYNGSFSGTGFSENLSFVDSIAGDNYQTDILAANAIDTQTSSPGWTSFPGGSTIARNTQVWSHGLLFTTAGSANPNANDVVFVY